MANGTFLKTYVFSTYEKSTDNCIDALTKKTKFPVEVIKDNRTFQEKYEDFLLRAYKENYDWFLRVDADIYIEDNINKAIEDAIHSRHTMVWWWQFKLHDWLRGIDQTAPSLINRKVIKIGQKYINGFFRDSVRPETDFSRIWDFQHPRRMMVWDEFVGWHDKDQSEENIVKKVKSRFARHGVEAFNLEYIKGQKSKEHKIVLKTLKLLGAINEDWYRMRE
jgi:hypothetical protein